MGWLFISVSHFFKLLNDISWSVRLLPEFDINLMSKPNAVLASVMRQLCTFFPLTGLQIFVFPIIHNDFWNCPLNILKVFFLCLPNLLRQWSWSPSTFFANTMHLVDSHFSHLSNHITCPYSEMRCFHIQFCFCFSLFSLSGMSRVCFNASLVCQ